MHASDLRTLVDYTQWANRRVAEAVARLTPEQYVKPMGNSFSSVRDTMVHLYAAEFLWNARLHGDETAAPPKPADYPDLASLRSAWAATETSMRALAAEEDDESIKRAVNFVSLSFGPGSATVAVILQHVANHATYHRGQVTTMLRQLGAAPPKQMDFTLYHRDKLQ